MRMRTVATLAAAILAGVSFARADDDGRKAREKSRARGHEEAPAESREAKFRSWDRDGNGTLSRAEYPGHPGNFRALDTDNDGQLTFEEFQHHAGAGAPAGSTTDELAAKVPRGPAVGNDEFGRLDTNGDGVITRGEWRGRPSVFDAMDGNRDGQVTRDEYARRAGSGRLVK